MQAPDIMVVTAAIAADKLTEWDLARQRNLRITQEAADAANRAANANARKKAKGPAIASDGFVRKRKKPAVVLSSSSSSSSLSSSSGSESGSDSRGAGSAAEKADNEASSESYSSFSHGAIQ